MLKEISDLLNATESVSGYFTNGINLLGGTEAMLAEYPYISPNAADSVQTAIKCFRNVLNYQQCKEDLVQGFQVLQDNLVDHFNNSQQIIFQASSHQKYGFDTIVYPAFTEHYQGITVAGGPYQILW